MTSPPRVALATVGAALCASAAIAFAPFAASSATPAATSSSPVASVQVQRGPYLQDGDHESVKVVWRTDTAVAGSVRYGRVPGPPWQHEAVAPVSGTEHVVTLAELIPGTRYFYQLQADGQPLGGTETLRTYAPQNGTRPFRFVAWGDSGNGSGQQLQLAAALDALAPAPDLLLGAGDLVYEVGAWADYDPKFFSPYRNLLRRSVLWPAIGNHDKGTSAGAPYFANFHLPTDTGASGHPSGTEAYYSFDHGSAHFVCVDNTEAMTVGDPQYNWIANDLDAANVAGARWRIVFAHKPPYTKGSHDSTTEQDLINVQTVLVPLLESKGVDLYIGGHSHVYERSYLVVNGVILDDDPSEYLKAGDAGTLYVVSGCGGKTGSGPLDHPLMAAGAQMITGHAVFDVSSDEIRGHFLEAGTIGRDSFVLRKTPDLTPPRLAAVQAIGADLDQVRVAFSEPVLPGAGPGGAESPSRYAITGGVSVLSATLLSDERTVLLQTTAPTKGTAHAVIVNGIVDQSPAANPIAPNSALAYALLPTAGVPQGDTWRYFEGLTFPGAAWMQPAFNDLAWPTGPAGFGYGDGDDATMLSGMQGTYLTVYVRRSFTLADPSAAGNLALRVSYDDGFVAFLNGVEVARSNVPLGQDETTPASGSHEADGFESFDLSGHLGLLVSGTNVLAVEGHNQSLSSGDFSLHPILEIVGVAPTGEQAPDAVLLSDVTTANAPTTVRFDATSSTDDGAITSYLIDFGDGTSSVVVPEATHVYASPGLYVASLIVTDDIGLQSVDEVPIFVHDVGKAPKVVSGVDDAFPPAGTAVSFDVSASHDPDGGELLVHWSFGDPASGPANHAIGATATHTYTAPGVYHALVLVTDDEGSQVAKELKISVDGHPSSGGGGGGCSITAGGFGSGGARAISGIAPILAALAGLLGWNAWRARAPRRQPGSAAARRAVDSGPAGRDRPGSAARSPS